MWLMATKEEEERRALICQGCEFRKKDKCTKCGCLIDYKVSFSLSNCPVGRWKETKEGVVYHIVGNEVVEKN